MISQVNVYVMDVMWILCDVWVLCLRVEVNIQQRVVCFREKASLRICGIILFECKDS